MTNSESIYGGIELFDKVGLDYEQAFGHDAGLHDAVKTCLDHLPTNASVLDCGCGTGKPVSEMIVDSGRRVHGIDFSPIMVELSRKQVPSGTFEMANMLEYVPSERFDGIIAMLSLFELSREEITTMGRKWGEWLKPGGKLLIGVVGADDCGIKPEVFDDDGKCARRVPFRFMGKQVRITLFTKGGWDEVLEKVAGLEIVHRITDLFAPPKEAESDPEQHYFVIGKKSSQT